MYVLLELWQKIMAIPIMNPLSWFMIFKITLQIHSGLYKTRILDPVFWIVASLRVENKYMQSSKSTI